MQCTIVFQQKHLQPMRLGDNEQERHLPAFAASLTVTALFAQSQVCLPSKMHKKKAVQSAQEYVKNIQKKT